MPHRKKRDRRYQVAVLVLLDLLAAVLAFSVGRWLVVTFHPYGRLMPPFGFWHLLGLVLIPLAWLYIAKSQGLYRETVYGRRLTQVPAIVRTVLLGMFVPFVYDYATKTNVFVERRSVPLVIGCIALALFVCARLVLFRAIYRVLLKRDHWVTRVLVLGSGEAGSRIAERIVKYDPVRLKFVGVVDPEQRAGERASDLVRNVIEEKQADEVVVALAGLSHQQMLEIRGLCGDGGVRVSFISDLFETLSERVDLTRIEGVPLLELKDATKSWQSLAAKRALDLASAFFLTLILSPLLLACALVIRRTSPGPALYRQKRIGKDGKEFMLYKFRTMMDNADLDSIHKVFVAELIKNGSARRASYKMKEDPRVTRIGQMLRRFSLDELPQLFNVLKGDMSLVGPRPPLPYELDSYKNWHMKRISVRPGITGLWQVAGRSGVPFDEMVMLDLYYIENWSLWMDVSLILKTLPAVVSGKGAY
jgi:exopolysaccharide biosynthesis polyprenyl glycosylphosphotransferase